MKENEERTAKNNADYNRIANENVLMKGGIYIARRASRVDSALGQYINTYPEKD